MYIIKKIGVKESQRKFVAKAGSKHSYTAKRENARKYPSYEAARQDLCWENEVIVKL